MSILLHPNVILMHEPCLNDFKTDDETCPSEETALKLLFEVEYMLNQISGDATLSAKSEDVAALHLRKSSIMCLLSNFEMAKISAKVALGIRESATAYYRLGVAHYLLSEFVEAGEYFLCANELDPVSPRIIKAIHVNSLRCKSKKDRLAFADMI